MGMLDGKVALVTGAGQGVGRAIAMGLAKAGAAVVVNDIGVSLTGAVENEGAAAAVVSEITAAGGRAVANADSVADPAGAQRMVEAAQDAFGRLDLVVNNAGILRDRIFHRMTQEDWSAVVSVHLNGSFNVSSAAAPLFREQGSGSFVHISSTSRPIATLADANYLAFRMVFVGFWRCIAFVLQLFCLRSNCIAPFALSRMISSIPTETEAKNFRVEYLKRMTPEKIALLVTF